MVNWAQIHNQRLAATVHRGLSCMLNFRIQPQTGLLSLLHCALATCESMLMKELLGSKFSQQDQNFCYSIRTAWLCLHLHFHQLIRVAPFLPMKTGDGHYFLYKPVLLLLHWRALSVSVEDFISLAGVATWELELFRHTRVELSGQKGAEQ